MAACFLPPSVRSYLGVEIDPDALTWAVHHAPEMDPRASFVSPDAFRAQGTNGLFDRVLLLEVVEHVEDPVLLLEEVLGHARPGGRVVISTPNGALSRHDPRFYQSPFHVTEYDPVEFRDLLTRTGRRFRLFEQHRLDRADLLPQLAGRIFVPNGRPRAPGSAPSSGTRKAHWLFRLWEQIPQPVRLWRIRPYPRPNRLDQGFSHLIAVVDS
jgi:SAM-dependent methyltransferase